MELHKLVSDILEGKAARVLSFAKVGLGPDEDISAGALCALNIARLVFAAERTTPVLSKILTLLFSKKTVESALAICHEWPSDVHLEVDDLYRIPLFEANLKRISTFYDSPTADHLSNLLENIRTLDSSAALLITRYPHVIACLRLRESTHEVFVLFNPRVTLDHERVVSLTSSSSLSQIVNRICDIFPMDKVHLAHGNQNLDWVAKSVEKCTGHVFVPRACAHDPRIGEDSLIVPSLTLLSLKAKLEELTHENGNLKNDKQRLEGNIVDLRVRLEDERAKTTRPKLLKPSEKTTHNTSAAQRSHLAHSFHSAREVEDLFDSGDDMDPNMTLALQLQATFDSENDFLQKQKHSLMQTSQRQYHCGICLDDFPEDDAVSIDGCGHQICIDCARGHACAKINEHRFPVLCPVCMTDSQNKRPGTLPGALVQLLGVSEKQWETWVEMELAQFSIPFTCRKCHHSAFVDKQDLEASPEIHCPFPACDHVWCKKCHQTTDPKGPTHSCDGTSELDHLMKAQGWRYCPNCKTPIQKSYGCNHLSCIAPGCNTHFCYGCGQTINRTAIPREIQQGKTAHFRTCPPV